MKPLKVYGWTGFRFKCPPSANGGKQTREIVAAKSWAEAARLSVATGGASLHQIKTYGSETGNAEELALALSAPRTVFWKPLDARNDPKVWRKAESTGKPE